MAANTKRCPRCSTAIEKVAWLSHAPDIMPARSLISHPLSSFPRVTSLCFVATEKDEGCNHMTCRKCRHDFCWICMQDWSLHSNNTGGFFQCNRFLTDEANGPATGPAAAAAAGARGEGSGSSAAAVTDEFINSRFAVEDHGSAQLEALRTRYVNS